MNVQLYNTLDLAYDFLYSDETVYKPRIKNLSRCVTVYKAEVNYKPYLRKEQFPCGKFILLLFFFFPAAIGILIGYIVENIKHLIEYKREKANFNFEEHRSKAIKDLTDCQKELDDIKRQREEHYKRCRGAINLST